MTKPDEGLLTDEKIEAKLVEEYMATLGWEYPVGKYNDCEDYDSAVKTVKWFLAKTASIITDFLEPYCEEHEHKNIVDFVGVPLDKFQAITKGAK